MTQSNRPTGMTAFLVLWIGQVVSLLGTAMTQFALTIWAFEETGQATALALVGFFYITPMLLLSPFAGAVVDRSNRKTMMIVSDLGAGVATIAVLILYNLGILEVWHLYITAALTGATESFQWPAYSAALSTMIKKEQYGRAHGLTSLAENGSRIFAPILGAAIFGFFGLGTILLIDIVTFSASVGALLFIIIPQPEKTKEGEASRGSFWQESMFGFRYIWKRKPLLGMQAVFLVGNFFATIAFTLIAPMILARTGSDEIILGSVQSVGAVGGVIGAVIMGAWGGPKKLVHGVFIGWMISGFFGVMPFGLTQSTIIWAATSFIGASMVPLINGSNQAIWQRKVPADLQGRVFSIRRLIAWLVNPLGTLIAGPLADQVMEPAMAVNGALSSSLGGIFGTGPGAGMAVIVSFAGLMAALSGLWPYFVRIVREIEVIMPDHDQAVPAD